MLAVHVCEGFCLSSDGCVLGQGSIGHVSYIVFIQLVWFVLQLYLEGAYMHSTVGDTCSTQCLWSGPFQIGASVTLIANCMFRIEGFFGAYSVTDLLISRLLFTVLAQICESFCTLPIIHSGNVAVIFYFLSLVWS